MRRVLLIGMAVAGILVVFFFVPLLPRTYVNYGRGAETAWVSPSFAFVQCGAFTGIVSVQAPDGGLPGEVPLWAASSNWNCEYPHLTG